jgi:hypothetical protein
MAGSSAPLVGMAAALVSGVSAPQQSGSLVLPTIPTPVTGGTSARSGGSEQRAVGRLATLVGDVVSRLELPADDRLQGSIAECNSALELFLEMQRDACDRDEHRPSAGDDLRRLARLLSFVDRADVPLVLRQIRRVLGRLDTRHTH